ncbi:MAG: sensor histidine kinase [Cyclobacteriaceae bacterium]|nr:sensor histidine kinase [Cyclobacteriaceae bacterium]MCH8516661.1 sensor histidine kinase [Cyclobacteriaceae bacterium]
MRRGLMIFIFSFVLLGHKSLLAAEVSVTEIALHINQTNKEIRPEEFNTLKFQKIPLSSSYNFGFNSQEHILCFKIESQTSENLNYVLQIPNINFNVLTLAQYDTIKGQWIEQRLGLETLNDSNQELKNFWAFDLKDFDINQAFYLRIQSDRPLILSIQVKPYISLLKSSNQQSLIYGFYYGLLLIIFIYSLFLFYYLKEPLHLYYALHIFFQLLISLVISGFGVALFGVKISTFSNYIPTISVLAYSAILLFAFKFLNLKDHQPQFFIGMQLFWVSFLTTIILDFFNYDSLAFKVGSYTTIILGLSLLVASFYAWKANFIGVRYFLIGFGSFQLGLIIYNLAFAGYVTPSAYTQYSIMIGLSIEALMITLGMTYRQYQLKLDYQRIQAEKMDLIHDQKASLEKEVSMRTTDIERKQTKIEEQNRLLQSRQKELLAINESLLSQKAINKAQNERLANLNKSLEAEVELRTAEIREMLAGLIKKNHLMEEYSYNISHHLRAPLARMEGIFELFQLEKNEICDNEWFSVLRKSSIELEEVIRDLNTIVDVENSPDMEYQDVCINDLINKIRKDYDRVIRVEKIDFQVENVCTNPIRTIIPYLKNILSCLISNAIKFRSIERSALVRLNVDYANNGLIIEVEDNGIGMNFKRINKDRIFDMYQKAHLHLPGKGLGLYLLRLQVEVLNGTVNVESEAGIGSKFMVWLPLPQENMNPID